MCVFLINNPLAYLLFNKVLEMLPEDRKQIDISYWFYIHEQKNVLRNMVMNMENPPYSLQWRDIISEVVISGWRGGHNLEHLTAQDTEQ